MSEHLLLIERKADWKAHFPRLPVAEVDAYLKASSERYSASLRVINLCRSQRYLSEGYYGSLLAEARGHRVIPSVRTLQDLSRKAIYSLDTEDLDRKVGRVLGRSRAGLQPIALELTMFFGQCAAKEMQEIAAQLFALFPAPMFRVEFRLQGEQWQIHALKPFALNSLSAAQEVEFFTALEGYLKKPFRRPRGAKSHRYDLAILHNPGEQLAPSSTAALKRFVRAGRALGVDVELIQARDFGRLAEFDALFIRETTRIDHYTYRFARKAEGEGMVVIDDPNSILRCTNKVYLAERLAAQKVPTPKTVILNRDTILRAEELIGYPVVLKIPDGSFSRGVFKASSRSELESIAKKLLKESDLILAQEFVYTDYDWRIGLLNKKPLYASQYLMSRQHWQIVNHDAKGGPRQGGFNTVDIADAPAAVVRTAVKAANLIGDGLYGVDLKLTERGVMVIEVNDNPNLDAGVEDKVLGETLYRAVMEDFVRRLDTARRSQAVPG
ncbi:Ribosomal protein S6 modification protein-related protein [Thioalkalivibrio nitratireducens DSM 14787]|uniref:Ribosomal protein S6 modification protein-related protein n=1 Tax=Thioalkalivibrio nitratireducens (strain DSM 14787 / UNIQEM 213 / ALEN2) TaxID=1255043 RepID=L0DRD8_THIND|nr:RimK family protein [Thioalkalivibrio nitratireducens]AGA32154.1 Ribosomal protein S6 modification protein-related protein [Thioalkalivibrio nitratireducens DSM 14787]